ncbi:MAG: response regulator transcription factor [Bacteroidota bacterium]|nr:response regulator transcription factor [Bacteroidota bacterium]
MNGKINVGIAEDHLLVRQGMVSLLKEFEELNILFDVGDGKELMNRLKEDKPDVVLLDIEMPNMNGREALEKIKIRYPKIKVIIISMHFEEPYIIEFIKKGANGFLPKNVDIELIVDAIYSAHHDGYYFDTKVSKVLAANLINPHNGVNTNAVSVLTDREIEILRYVCFEKTNREIAEILNISQRTVEGHRKSILDKTGAKTSMGMVIYAIKNKYVNV